MFEKVGSDPVFQFQEDKGTQFPAEDMAPVGEDAQKILQNDRFGTHQFHERFFFNDHDFAWGDRDDVDREMVVCGEYEVGGQQHGGFVVFNGNLPAVRADHGGANLPLAQQEECPAGGALHGDVFARFVMR